MSESTPPDPGGDPSGWLVDFLGRYIPPGYITSLIRTWVPISIGAALAWVAVHWHIVVSGQASATVGVIAAGVVTAAYYALARIVERRWPRIGRWLVALNLVSGRPVYAAPTETVRVLGTRTGTVRSE